MSDTPGATKFPPGHYYSPIPSLAEVRARSTQIFDRHLVELPGIDLNPGRQLKLLESLSHYYDEMPFGEHPTNSLRYGFNNIWYGYSDAILYYSMLREFQPKRLIEIGSGQSSALAMDVNDLFLGGSLDMTFIEPFPDRLTSLMTDFPANPMIRLLPVAAQDVPLETFDVLDDGDFLFIDSTHVGKVGSDVNRIYFEILPRLRSGVIVHIHDIFEGFEYPQGWIMQGWAWSEAYILRAFLIGNRRFEILLMNTYMEHHYREWFQQNMPLCLKNPGGSIWLKVL